MQLTLTVGMLTAPEDSVITDLRTDGNAPYHVMLAIHGMGGSVTKVPYILLVTIADMPVATEMAREALTGTDEFIDVNDIYAAPIYYEGYVDERVKFQSV